MKLSDADQSVQNIEAIKVFGSQFHMFVPELCKGAETGYEGQGMIVTLQADLDPYPDLFRPVMREIIGRSRSTQGVLGPFPGLLLPAKREITSKS